MTNNQNKTKKQHKKPSNFAEALLELSRSTPQTSQKESISSSQKETDWLKQRLKKEKHQEVIASIPVFNRQEEEVKQKIDQILEELKALAKEIAGVGVGIDKAIHEQTVSPGTYHITFFEMIRRDIQQLKKKASESKNWLAISQQRKQGQSHYWGNVKKSGTSYMLSSERTIATQSG